MTPFEAVLEFHKTYNVPVGVPFTEELVDLRVSLCVEECKEVEEELWLNSPEFINKKRLTKELADLLYVTIGTAVTFGLPLEEVFNEVHKSNMSKLGEDGKPIYREDGKVLKGPNYKEPDLEKFFK